VSSEYFIVTFSRIPQSLFIFYLNKKSNLIFAWRTKFVSSCRQHTVPLFLNLVETKKRLRVETTSNIYVCPICMFTQNNLRKFRVACTLLFVLSFITHFAWCLKKARFPFGSFEPPGNLPKISSTPVVWRGCYSENILCQLCPVIFPVTSKVKILNSITSRLYWFWQNLKSKFLYANDVSYSKMLKTVLLFFLYVQF
jgi:hypothetical protein